MKKRISIINLLIIGICISVGYMPAKADARAEGIRFEDMVIGSGQTAQIGDIVTIELDGWLVNHKGDKGGRFIDTEGLGQQISFKLGTERVMAAWNRIVEGMKVGGKRRAYVPSELGYGAKGVGNLVPPNTDLILEIELLNVQKI